MIDSDGRTVAHGDRILVYRPGVTECATMREPDPRLGLSTPVVLFKYDDGFTAAHGLDASGYPVVPDSWRIVKAANNKVITEPTTVRGHVIDFDLVMFGERDGA